MDLGLGYGRRSVRLIVGEEAAVLAALVEAHVDDFEGHVLGAIVAHEGGGLDVAKAELKL